MGEKIIGKYAYDKFLGEGSFGKVYKGRNVETGEIVAVKCMDMNKLTDPYMLNALNTEIQVQMSLKSLNVVRLYDVIQTPQITYIVLELCPNGDLDKFLEQNGGMVTENIAINVLKQLMNGFQEMASHNFIHRDIKPANCLVKENVFKVADFGFACEADLIGKTLIKECVGTPLFMAPQLLENHPYTSKSDIWSIGMMFYMMIFGGTPWPCRDRNSFLDNMKRYPLKFPYDKPIKQDTKDFIQRCLTVNEDQRIGWQEIFHHPLLIDNHEEKQIEQHQVYLDDASKRILSNLQRLMHYKNIDAVQFFNSFDFDHGGFLDQNEFYSMIRNIDPQITFGECSRLFQQIANTHINGALTLTEFLNIIQQFDFSDINDRGSRFIHDLSEILRTNNINLFQFFSQFDLDKSNLMDFREFTNMMQQVAPGFTQREIELIFNKFDQNGDKKINFLEFQACLNQGTQPQGYQESWLKVKNQVKNTLNQKNLNFSQIFPYFDSNADGLLNDQEFGRLINYVDQYIHQDEIRELYTKINKNLISLNDIYTLFA